MQQSEKNGNNCPPQMRAGRIFTRIMNSVTDTLLLIVFLGLLAFGCYAVWDSRQVQQQAQSNVYEIYKPEQKDSRSFSDFRIQNPEVFGWLEIYGTNIDYPLVQGENNEKYLNTSADGKYSLSGSIYLDYRNKNDLSDFNSIIYGHHMEGQVMFGEIGKFKDENYFKNHRYASLYCNEKYYGLEFFAFLEIDAYDQLIYHPAVKEDNEKEEYLRHIKDVALYYRELGVGKEDKIVLLSTCTTDMTNGRHILVGRLSEQVWENPFQEEEHSGKNVSGFVAGLSLGQKIFWGSAAFAVIVLVSVILILYRRK